jgi:hypothetical protein
VIWVGSFSLLVAYPSVWELACTSGYLLARYAMPWSRGGCQMLDASRAVASLGQGEMESTVTAFAGGQGQGRNSGLRCRRGISLLRLGPRCDIGSNAVALMGLEECRGAYGPWPIGPNASSQGEGRCVECRSWAVLLVLAKEGHIHHRTGGLLLVWTSCMSIWMSRHVARAAAQAGRPQGRIVQHLHECNANPLRMEKEACAEAQMRVCRTLRQPGGPSHLNSGL